MKNFDTVRTLYAGYLARCEKLESERRPGDGLLGFGSGPDSDPCHEAFSDELGRLLREMAAHPSTPEEALAVLKLIYRAPLEHRSEPLPYWMLMAVQSLTPKLVAVLSEEDRADLLVWYRKAYPPFMRLPAQKKVLAALKA